MRVLIGSSERVVSQFTSPEESRGLNSAHVERLSLFLRRSCCYLPRRTSGEVRNPERLGSSVEILSGGYNYIRPPARLRLKKDGRAPAMMVSVFGQVLSSGEVFG